ncbi:MAG: sulfate permease [Betaproteobacteria bacterium]|nr:sulfate permease [Betaproteobacteria bacterium]
MLVTLLWTLSVRTRNFLRTWAPTNILLDHLRARRGITCYLIAFSVALGYFALTVGTAWAVQEGWPKWLYLAFFWCLWNASKFILFIPIEACRRMIRRLRTVRPARAFR